jgi:iron complex outermembrane receptor protein
MMGSRICRSPRVAVRKILISGQLLICAGASLLAAPALAAQQSSTDPVALEEVLVTAQKRTERLQDVPVPVTALSADTLAVRNQTRMQDYFADVPGLNLSSAGNGQKSLSIRGLTAGSAAGGSPTVGVTIDDVPRGFSTAPAFSSSLYEDLDPSDLERVEVLRGPQGTLYGAASIGGLIKFVTTDPSTAGFAGRMQTQVTSVDGELGYGLRGAVNIPVSDTFALRASGFTRRDGGYVENVTTGKSDVNQADVNGGRVSALWNPSESLSLKLSAMLQDTQADGSNEVDLNLGGLRHARMPGSEGYDQKTTLYSAVLNAEFAGISLISVSGYGNYEFAHAGDNTAFYGGFAQDLFGVGGASLVDTIDSEKFSQEFRLTSPTGRKVEWLLGAFYTHEKTAAHQSLLANNPTTGAVVGSQVEIDFPTSFFERAVFGDITVHLSDRFNVQLGARFSENRQRYDEIDDGPLFGGVFITPTRRTKARANTFLFTPQFKVSEDLMVYARFASGYRAGGPNANVPGNPGFPINYEPDKDYSYDVGIKGQFLDNRLTFDAAAYHIDWKNVQIAVIDEATQFLIHTNGGRATSQGLELALQARPAQGLTIDATTTFGDAKLKDDLPPISTALGSAGDALPFSSRFSGSLSVDQEFALGGSWTGSAGGSIRRVGVRRGDFINSATAVRARLPSFTHMDLRAGARKDSLNVTLFLNNVGDKRGFIGRGADGPASPATALFIEPRTIGLSVSKEF